MKIVYFVASSDISGGQRVIFQQAEGLAKLGHEVILACPEPKPTWFPIRNAKWVMMPFSRTQVLRKADILVATYWTTVHQARHAFSGPVFHLCQGYEADFSFNQPFLKEIKAAYAEETIKLAVSHHVAARLKSAGYSQVAYVGQTFDSDEFPPAKKRNFDRHSPTIILAGIFEAEVKGIREALHAMSQLHQTGVSFHLHRISTWPQSTAEKHVFSAHTYDLRLMPEEMARAYRDADLLIGPSHPEEGFGLHVLEALSSGLPTLLSNTPAHLHIARNAAEYFQCGDPTDILEKLKALLPNRSHLQELSRLGPVEAARFGTENVVKNLIRLFTRSLDLIEL